MQRPLKFCSKDISPHYAGWHADLLRMQNLTEEVVSDVFLNVWIKKDKIEIKINLKTYLYTAVRNQSLNYVKKNRIYFEEIETVVKENKISDLVADKLIIYEELKDEMDYYNNSQRKDKLFLR